MAIAYILAGLVFLFNPHINIIDILPDAAGYGLILYGILRLSRVDVNMNDAFLWTKRLFILSLCKIPCLYVYALISAEEQLWVLLLSLGFGIAEAVMGVFMFSSLFHAIDSLASEERDQTLYRRLPSAKILSLVFVVAKPVMAILPDLTLLADDRYGVVTGNGIQSIKNYRNVFNVFSFLTVLVFGIVWLVSVLRFFSAVKKEKALLGEIDQKIAAFETVDTLRHFRYLITVFAFLFYAVMLCLELKIEGYSLLPPMINAALFALAIYLLYRFFKESAMKKTALSALIASVAYFVFSTVGYILSYLFADTYYHEDIGGGFADEIYFTITRDFDAFDDLLIANIFVLLSQIAFAVMILMLTKLFADIIEHYCGNPESRLSEKDRTDAMAERDANADRVIKIGLQKGKKVFLSVSLLTALSSALFPMLEVYFNEFFMIDLAVRVIFVLAASSYLTKLKKAVKVKGALDFD